MESERISKSTMGWTEGRMDNSRVKRICCWCVLSFVLIKEREKLEWIKKGEKGVKQFMHLGKSSDRK